MITEPQLIEGESVKRQRMDLSDYGGMNIMSVDGSRADPMSDNLVGINENWTSEGVNESIEVKFFTVPPKLCPRWSNEYPEGCILFGCAAQLVADFKKNATRGRQYYIRGMDLLEMLTPQQLNMHLHLLWKNLPNMQNEPTLQQLLLTWRCLGQNVAPPTDSHGKLDSYQNKRLGEERAIPVRPLGDCKITNYWGKMVSGTQNCFLYFVLKFVPVTTSQITYVLNEAGTDVQTISTYENGRKDPQTRVLPLNGKKMEYVPKLVPVCCNNPNSPSDEELSYDWIIYDEARVNCTTIKRRGEFIRVGQCVQNRAFDPTIPRQAMGELIDMSLDAAPILPHIDVMVNIRDSLSTPY